MANICLTIKEMVTRIEAIPTIWEDSPIGLLSNGHRQQWIKFKQVFIVSKMPIIVFM